MTDAARADEALSRSEDRALLGIPGAVKDLIVTKGIPTTAASRILADYLPPYNATVVERLIDAGYALLGKTNLDEFALGTSNETSFFGPCKNPWDRTRVPGGSSGGSAAAVAAGLTPFALGTDTGGSIRQPASLCGVVGMKPSYGRISRYGAIALASSLDQVGVLARTVEDAETVYKVMQGFDPHDGTTVDMPESMGISRQTMNGLTIGITKEYVGSRDIDAEGVEPGVRDRFREALVTFEGLGARVVEVSLPHTAYACAVYQVIMASELSSNLARLDGIRFGGANVHPPHAVHSLKNWYEEVRGLGFGPETKRRVMLGTYTLSSGYFEAYYRKAKEVQNLIAQDFQKAFTEVDIIACPTSPTVAFRFGAVADNPIAMHLADIFTLAMNLAGLPAMSVPCGFAPAPEDQEASPLKKGSERRASSGRPGRNERGGVGLPVGLQLIGKKFDEASIFMAGKSYQAATDFHMKLPPTPRSLNS